jgi:Phage protein Gp138 N-terminal domain
MSTPAKQLNQAMLNYAETAQWKAIVKQALLETRCAAPATVQSFDPVKQVVTVQINISELVDSPNGPAWTAIYPISNVPICLPRGGGFALTLPIVQGDEGMLVFCDSCIDLWWQEGGIQPPPGGPLVQPNFEQRRHDVTDCGFYPGMWNQKRVLANYSGSSAQLRSDDGTVIIDVSLNGITFTAPKVTLNSNGDLDLTASGVVKILSNGGDTTIDGKDFLNHQHTGVSTGTGDTGPVL